MGKTKKGNFDSNSFSKHNPEIHSFVKFYAFVQFLLVTVFSLFFLDGGGLTYEQSVTALALVIFTMFCITQWLDGFKLIALETFRLFLLLSLGVYLFMQNESLLSNILLGYSVLNLMFLPLLANKGMDNTNSPELIEIVQKASIKTPV